MGPILHENEAAILVGKKKNTNTYNMRERHHLNPNT
jgi:hypothetical protein